MDIRIAILALACAALAGCDSPGAVATNAAIEISPDPVEAKIAALPEPLQRVTFFRAIQDAGYTCQNIVTAQARGRIDGNPVWAVVCDDDGQYLLTLERGGIFKVSGVPQPKRR